MGWRKHPSPGDLWAKGGGPFKLLAFAGRGQERGGHSDGTLWAPPLEEVFPSRPAAPMLPPIRYSSWFCSDLRAPTSPCLGSVSVKLRVRVKHPLPIPDAMVDSTGDFPGLSEAKVAKERKQCRLLWAKAWGICSTSGWWQRPWSACLDVQGLSGAHNLTLPPRVPRVRRGLLLPEYNLIELDGYSWIQCLWALDP